MLEDVGKTTPQYMEGMEQVFEQCQQFEEKRLVFLKEVLLDIKRHLNLAENSRYWARPLSNLECSTSGLVTRGGVWGGEDSQGTLVRACRCSFCSSLGNTGLGDSVWPR